MSVLLIDIGNTRLKWKRIIQDKESQSGTLLKSEVPHYQWPDDIEDVVVASVSTNDELRALFQQKYGASLKWLSEPDVGFEGFHHCYPDPQRLGVDRWLAMLGARVHSKNPVLVVDAGTALTIDLLNEHNQHIGGYIVPGQQMSAGALFGGTDRVEQYLDEADSGNMSTGTHTRACVSAGILRQQLAFIESVGKQYPQYELFITGGDGRALAEHTETGYYPNLIFDGMELLCAG